MRKILRYLVGLLIIPFALIVLGLVWLENKIGDGTHA